MVKSKFLILIVITLPLIIYLKTLLPGHEFHDIGELQTAACTLGIAHPPGYPTYIVLGKIFTLIPINNPAWRVNFMSAFFSISSLVLLYLIAKKYFKSNLPALFTTLILAFIQNFWFYSLVAEMYSLNIFFMNLFLYFILVKFDKLKINDFTKYYLFFFILGLAQGNHRNITIITPFLVLFFFFKKPLFFFKNFKKSLILVFAFLLGLSIYLFLPLRAMQNPYLNYAKPTTWKNFKYLVTAEQFRFLMFTVPLKKVLSERIVLFWQYLKEQFFLPGISLAFLGLGWLIFTKKYKLTILLILIFIINTFVWLSYNTNDVYRYMTPSYVIFSLFIGAGINIFYVLTNKIKLNRLKILIKILISLPLIYFIFFFITTNFKKVDQSHNQGAYDWGMEVLNNVKPNAVVISHWGYSPALWYLQGCLGLRPDIIVADDRVMLDENWGTPAETVRRFINNRPVYVIYSDGHINNIKEAGFEVISSKGVMEVLKQ